MANFKAGETITCSITITNTTSGALTDPATSMTVTITDPVGTKVVDTQNMTNSSIGKYYYDYASGGSAINGTYIVKYTATDATRVSISYDTFRIEG